MEIEFGYKGRNRPMVLTLLLPISLFYINLGKLDAVLILEGYKTNFYKQPFESYDQFKMMLAKAPREVKDYTSLLKRFRFYGCLLLISLSVYPILTLYLYLNL